jgi:outer membrane protein, heavy metal efflux system
MFVHFPARCAVASGLFVALAWAAVFPAHAAEAPLTLDAAIRRGTSQAPLLAAHRAHISAMQEEAVRAGRLPDPTLSVGVDSYPVTAPGAFSLRSDEMTMRTVGLTQAIPSRAARAAERALAVAQEDAAAAEHAATQQTVQQQIADAWIGVWAAGQRLALLRELRDEGALAVQVAQARLRGGEGNATEALAARAAVEALENRLEAATADQAAAEASLQRWLPDTTATTLAAAPDFARLPFDPQQLDRALDRQAPMQAWQAQEQVAEAALAQARAARHPDWSVSLMYGKRAPYLSDMVSLQVGVSLPLFTRNRQDRAVAARQAQWDAVQASHEDARRAQRETVARTLAAWQGWGRRITRDHDRLLPLARDRSRTALAGYRGGGALQPWLDARRDELELRLGYVDALARRAQSWAALAYLLPPPEPMP